MQRYWLTGAIAAAAALVSGVASAQNPTSQNGLALRCEGACVGASARTKEASLVAECRRVARVMGPLSRYVSGGRELSDAALRECNRPVRPFQTARN